MEVKWGVASPPNLPSSMPPDANEESKNFRIQLRLCRENATRLADGSRPWIVVGQQEGQVLEILEKPSQEKQRAQSVSDLDTPRDNLQPRDTCKSCEHRK